jgi:biofilm PGA synthesis N-glycosyltransferase PgaC
MNEDGLNDLPVYSDSQSGPAGFMNSQLACADRRYVVISPVRDEAKHLSGVIQSMLEQTVRPVQWILVNDGSVDQTPDIVNQVAARESWITAVHLPQRQTREPGTAVIKAFYEGY